ncbi:MAG: hypothetical protein IMZ71_02635 [Chloroflexi bacterium]|nr:hypothetical protein [Chloroflexota bacterium]
MKRRIVLCIIAVALLAGCMTPAYLKLQKSWVKLLGYREFEEVSQLYLDKLGPPEEATKHESRNYKSVTWTWWTKGLRVTFKNASYNQSGLEGIIGWEVDSTFIFEPRAIKKSVR